MLLINFDRLVDGMAAVYCAFTRLRKRWYRWQCERYYKGKRKYYPTLRGAWRGERYGEF